MMEKVGFSKKMMTDPVTTLSGGWRMKLALSRAMLQITTCCFFLNSILQRPFRGRLSTWQY